MPQDVVITVPSKCAGIDMSDGTRYPASGGKIKIDNPKHAKAYLKSGNGQMVGTSISTFSELHTVENNCPTCGFVGWPWQKTCPKCATDLEISKEMQPQ